MSFTVEALAATSGINVRPKTPVKPTKDLDVTRAPRRVRCCTRRGHRQRAASALGIPLHRDQHRRDEVADTRRIVSRPRVERSQRRDGTRVRGRRRCRRRLSTDVPSTPRQAPSGTAEFRRYIDHLDINGDGIDEIVLEGWQFAGETYVSVLGYANGEWSEVFRGSLELVSPAPKRATE